MAKKIRILTPIVVAFLLLMALMPSAIMAADEGVTEGSVGCGNSTPTIDNVSLTYANDGSLSPTDTLEPWQTADGTGYKLTFTVTDYNKLEDIDQIDVYVHYDADADDVTGDVGSQDTNTEAEMTWVPSGGGAFSMSTPGSDTWPGTGEWAINTASSDEPGDLTATQGTWIFVFQISKVATEVGTVGDTNPDWDVYIKVDDGGTPTWDNTHLVDYKMVAYRELSVSPGTVSFSSVNPGSTDKPASGSPYPIEVTTIANDEHKVQIKSETPWVGDPDDTENIALDNDGSPGEGDFSLHADADETSGDVLLSTAQWVTDDWVDLETGLLIRQSPAGTKVYSRLWLDMGNGVKAQTYSGDITYKIV